MQPMQEEPMDEGDGAEDEGEGEVRFLLP